MATEASLPICSTAAVNRLIGRVSVLAMNTASAAALSTAINPTSSELFWIAAAGAMNTAFGVVSMTPTHRSPARMAGAIAAPPRFPAWSGTMAATPSIDPRAAASEGKSRVQSVGAPNCEPNSRLPSGLTR